MKKKAIHLAFLAIILMFGQFSFGQATDLIISEYIEGSSNNKALEIYNGTGATVDLSQYRMVAYNNGGTTISNSIVLSGNLVDGDVYVIANASAGPEISAVADITSSVTFYNGDDYLALEKEVATVWQVIDVIGVLGEDPGSCWPVADESCGTKEHTLVRKPDICSPTTNWATSAGTSAGDSQWIVYAQDDFTYIGSHTSSCSGPVPLNADFTADDPIIYPGETVTFSDLTTGGTPPYTLEWDLDGDNVYESSGTNPQFTYNTVGKYTVRLRVTDNAKAVDIEEKVDFVSATDPNVANLGELRNGDIGQEYTVTGEVVLTFQQSFRNQKYIEDATAAILIDDAPGGNFDPGVITTSYSIGDGITGLIGTLSEFGNMLQFVPSADPGAATSTGNTITPQVITLSQLFSNFEDYEAELVTIDDVNFTDAGSTFANGTVYPISDASKATGDFRTTFFDVDYIGTTIPATANITGLPNSRSDGDYITSRNSADIEIQGLPVIDKVITVSSTEVDVYYNIAPPSVDPGDYQLTGTSSVIFSGATIDGVDPKIVHLTGGSPAMVGDITQDLLIDGGYASDFTFYAGILPISFMNVNNPGGTMANGIWATFQGIVSANDNSNNFWFSDGAGQRAGTFTYSPTLVASVNVGDEIILAGKRDLYFDNAQIADPILISVESTGNAPYGPTTIPGSDIEATIPVDTDPAEAWESQLVKIENFSVVAQSGSNYECTWSDGTKVDFTFYIGNAVSDETVVVGADYLSVTGVVDWRGDTQFYRINPRDAGDLVLDSGIPVKLAIISVNNGVDPFESTDFSVVVQAQDVNSDPAIVTSDVNFTFTTNGGDGGNVDFVLGTTTNGTVFSGTSQVTVTGVQMAPTGTNVTITATDDLGGLTAGVSLPFDVVQFTPPEIIITEIMNNPFTVGDSDGEWFEVFNNGDSDVDMNGWTIRDDGSDSHLIASSVVVPSKGFAVFGNNIDQGVNGGYVADYQYNGMFLGNGADEIVLVYSDGTTEIDRVNYDGGTEWPDPTGTPMVFTGLPTADNNVGANWSIATFAESTYNSNLGDRGSPGTNGYDQMLYGGFKLDLKVFLEGSYNVDNDDMNGDLRSAGVIPVEQPFNPSLPYYGNSSVIWSYAGTEAASFYQFGTEDYVLVELRDAQSAANATSGTLVDQKAALLQTDGSVGYSPLVFDVGSYTYGLWIVIWHRNHLGILSSSAITPSNGDVISYDFTTGSDKVYNGSAGYTELETGVWGLTSGDVNGDGVIDNDDLNNGWSVDAGINDYSGGDLNLDAQTNNPDKNDFWVPNSGGTSTQVPN